MHQDREAEDCPARHRPSRGEAREGRLARVLRRQAGPLHRQASEEVPDVVHRGVPGGQDDAGGPVSPRHDLPGGGEADQACAEEVGLLDSVRWRSELSQKKDRSRIGVLVL